MLWAISACDMPRVDYIPIQETVINHYSSLLNGASEITGIYGNHDVDSILFSYKTNSKDFFNIITSMLSDERWMQEKKEKNEVIMVRYNEPEFTYADFNSLEIVKIYNIDNLVCVGYIQLDSKNKIDISSETAETAWVKKHFWPKYEQCKST